MINWRQQFALKRNEPGNVVLIEFDCGQAVVIPKDTPLDKVNEIAESQYKVMKG